jgi:hypothetical protein
MITYARRESAAPPAPINLCSSAIVEANDRSACGKQLQCRTVPAARQTPCARGQTVRLRYSPNENIGKTFRIGKPAPGELRMPIVSQSTAVISVKPKGEPWRAMAQGYKAPMTCVVLGERCVSGLLSANHDN